MDNERLEEARQRFGLGVDATPEEIVVVAHQNIAPSAPLATFGQSYFDYNPVKIRGGGSDWYALVEKGIAGLTVGLSDELAAAVAGAVLAYQDGEDWAKHYASRRKYFLDRRATTSERLGTKATMADMGGMVVGTILTGGAGAAGRTGLAAAGRVAASGALRGGVRGMTMSEKEDLAGRAQDAVVSAGVGAVAGALPYTVGPTVQFGTRTAQRALNTLGTPGKWLGYAASKAAKHAFSKSKLADRAGETATGRAIADLAKAVSAKAPKLRGKVPDPNQLSLFPQARATGGPLQWMNAAQGALAGGIGTSGHLAGAMLNQAAPYVAPLTQSSALAVTPPSTTQAPELAAAPRASMAASPVGQPMPVPQGPGVPMQGAKEQRPSAVSTEDMMKFFNSEEFEALDYDETAKVIQQLLAGEVPELKKKKKTRQSHD